MYDNISKDNNSKFPKSPNPHSYLIGSITHTLCWSADLCVVIKFYLSFLWLGVVRLSLALNPVRLKGLLWSPLGSVNTGVELIDGNAGVVYPLLTAAKPDWFTALLGHFPCPPGCPFSTCPRVTSKAVLKRIKKYFRAIEKVRHLFWVLFLKTQTK